MNVHNPLESHISCLYLDDASLHMCDTCACGCMCLLYAVSGSTGVQDAPVANAKPEDIQELLGGALFKALYKWMEQDGPIYLLPTGPVSSFLVICDPAAAKHVLQLSDNPKNNVYSKGLVAEVSEFLFGLGFATACVFSLCYLISVFVTRFRFLHTRYSTVKSLLSCFREVGVQQQVQFWHCSVHFIHNVDLRTGLTSNSNNASNRMNQCGLASFYIREYSWFCRWGKLESEEESSWAWTAQGVSFTDVRQNIRIVRCTAKHQACGRCKDGKGGRHRGLLLAAHS